MLLFRLLRKTSTGNCGRLNACGQHWDLSFSTSSSN